jgi:RecJ-like exonuclease
MADAHVRSTRIIADQLPIVTADVMRLAQTHEIYCPTCRGDGTVEELDADGHSTGNSVVCDACRGTGKILEASDIDRQKLALEIGELLKKDIKHQTTIVDASQHLTTTFMASTSLERLQQAVRDTLYPSTVIETEPLLETDDECSAESTVTPVDQPPDQPEEPE